MGIIEVKLDRPGAKNSIGKDMLRGLQHSFEAINRDSSANILMISSSVPRVFCAGADLKERKTMSSSEVQAFVNSLRSTFSYLEALHIPTIAVIEGAALGGGLEMALSCDLWICGEDAVLGLPETGLAIIPGAGGTQWLPRLVGRSVAKELIFCGRKVGGRDAVSMGLVNHCVPAGEAHLKALEIARNINQKGISNKRQAVGIPIRLKPKDVVIFYGPREGKLASIIGVECNDSGTSGGLLGSHVGLQPDLQCDFEDQDGEDERGGNEMKKRFKLFGVEIKVGGGNGNGNGV
ncbi:unnamed protein product [Camellia sinensis]